MASVDGVYRAKSGFSAYHEGSRYIVRYGDIVREGHWVLMNYPAAFVPLEVDHDVAPPAQKKAEPKAEPKVEPKPEPKPMVGEKPGE